MSIRTSTKTITFSRPFTLSALDVAQPAGAYSVETEEEIVPFLSFVAYRRIATWLTLAPQPGSSTLTEIAQVDPIELEAALAKDAAPAVAGISLP